MDANKREFKVDVNGLSKKYLDDLTYEVVGAAIEVHKELGGGLLESIYHHCMKEELSYRRINYVSELKIPIVYRKKEIQVDFRCDLFNENSLVVELKAVTELPAVHEAQLFTYMKLLKAPKGLLINFNCKSIFQEGQRTFVNEYFRDLPDTL